MVDEEDENDDDDEDVRAKKLEEKKKLDGMKACCKDDYLYPSITLGRRRCRRGHSIRKSRLLRGSILTQKSYPPSKIPAPVVEVMQSEVRKEVSPVKVEVSKSLDSDLNTVATQEIRNGQSQKSLGSDEDFESFLRHQNYDSKEPLAGDLLSYFDLKLQTPTSSMATTTTATASMSDLLEDDYSLIHQRTSMSMSDLIDYQSDNELDDSEDRYFNQDALLDTLRRQSKNPNDDNDDDDESFRSQPFIHLNKVLADDEQPTNEDDDEDDKTESFIMEPTAHGVLHNELDFDDDCSSPESLCISEKTICINLDSDEGSSISSGCETSSTVTTNTEDALPRRGSVLDRVRSFEQLAESQVNRMPLGERGSSGKFFARSVTFPTGSSSGSKSGSFIEGNPKLTFTKGGTLTRSESTKNVKLGHDSDEELSDESGYVEFQDHSLKSTYA